ncbi:MAG: hypothetical protein F2732_02180 [Actinobacteria bacterium]|uniref:Unannotated protein n=1 Tax=freshwater metagenome TaxID=449393 RepID=A0A6J6X155_9ZZZZ|nr:hypothetical protein [Actinomycetota bacterium]
MTAIPSRQRNRMLAALACGVASACLLPIGGVIAARSLLNSSGGTRVDDSGALLIPATPAALLATVNDVNQVTSLTAFVLDPSGVGGTIISLPVGTRAESIGQQSPHRLADTFAQAGVEAMLLEAEGALDVTFSVVGAVGRNDLAGVLNVLPPIPVTFESPVMNTAMVMPDPATTTTIKPRSSRSTETTLPPQPVAVDSEFFPAGEQMLTGDQAALVLYAQRLGEPELDRLTHIKAMWNGVAAAVGTGLAPEVAQFDPALVGTELPNEIGAFVRRVLGGPIQVWQLSAQPLVGADNPLGIDIYSLDRFEVLMIMASVAPSSLSIANDTLAVQVDSPFNDANITHAIVERLSYLNVTVALIRNLTISPQQKTVIKTTTVIADELKKIGLDGVVGPISYGKWEDPVQGIGAQIVLGQDFVDFLESAPALPPTTVATDG